MSAEQAPDIADLVAVLADHRLRDVNLGWAAHCACGGWSLLQGPGTHRAHVAAALAPVLAAAVREARAAELREAADEMPHGHGNHVEHWEGTEVNYWLYESSPDDRTPMRWLRDRADRITEPVSHEAATSGEEASKA